MGVDANTRPPWLVKLGDASGRGHKGFWVFGVDAAFHGMPAPFDVFLAVGQYFTGGDEQLLFDDVHTGDELRHRVLDLHACVHLDKVELAVLVQKFEGAGAAVADLAAGLGAAFADAGAHFFRDAGGRRLLHHFLVAALHGAVALAQVDGVAVFVCQHLEFHVARIFQVLFHVDHVVVERRLGLGAG